MIILGIGTNLGDKVANIHEALELLEKAGVKTLRPSSLYITAPWGKKNQPEFLNMVAEVAFEGSPQELLKIVLGTEKRMGRVREEKWGPRLIDIDLLEFNGQTLEDPGLTLPHPYYPERVFVLLPLAELEPDWVPTGREETVSELLSGMDLSGIKLMEKIS